MLNNEIVYLSLIRGIDYTPKKRGKQIRIHNITLNKSLDHHLDKKQWHAECF